LAVARFLYPKPENLEHAQPSTGSHKLPWLFWVYLIGAGLVAAGFADYQLIAFHFQKNSILSKDMIPVFYAVAMGVSGAGSLLFGKLYDRFGISILIPVTLLSALFAPLVFLGGFWMALAGACLWGLGMGVHESIIPAAVANMVAPERRPSAYGIFTAGYGVFWFIGSALMGLIYDQSLHFVVAFCVVLEISAIPIFFFLAKKQNGLAH
jgi:predicted MFS family arabinose efflux permease